MNYDGIQVVRSKKLSFKENRYVIINKNTGEIIDDAQGYGYRTEQKAYKAYCYKQANGHYWEPSKELINWCRRNKEFIKDFEDFAFHIAKGSYGEDTTLTVKLATDFFIDVGELPFTIKDFLKFFKSKDFSKIVFKK